MEPPVARLRSAMTRSSVVLPQPDGPISETKSPLLTVRLMSLSAVTGVSAVWNTRFNPTTSTAGWRAAGDTSAPLRSRSLSILATASSPGGLGQHGNRRPPRDIAGVVPGARHDAPMRETHLRSGLPHRVEAGLVLMHRRRPPDLFIDEGETKPAANLIQGRVEPRLHLQEHVVVGMAQIDGEEHRAGNRVARIGADLNEADRRDAGLKIE